MIPWNQLHNTTNVVRCINQLSLLRAWDINSSIWATESGWQTYPTINDPYNAGLSVSSGLVVALKPFCSMTTSHERCLKTTLCIVAMTGTACCGTDTHARTYTYMYISMYICTGWYAVACINLEMRAHCKAALAPICNRNTLAFLEPVEGQVRAVVVLLWVTVIPIIRCSAIVLGRISCKSQRERCTYVHLTMQWSLLTFYNVPLEALQLQPNVADHCDMSTMWSLISGTDCAWVRHRWHALTFMMCQEEGHLCPY